ncbi:MAG: CbiQ family ECF transporter T component [Kiritimatiellia bacterium]
MTAFLDFWGSGSIRMRRLAPSTRIVCGALVFATCLVCPAQAPLGMLLVCGIMLSWVLLCGLPWNIVAGLSLYAALLFLPLFLFTPWLTPSRPSVETPWFCAANIPLEIGVRGVACIFVCASTIAVLDLAEFAAGLGALPIPRMIQHLMLQFVHQTAMLTNETRRVASALSVRGLPSGFTLRLRFLPALPTVWLLRILHRADRVGAAMEVRGFDLSAGTVCSNISALDAFAVAAASLLLGAIVVTRWLIIL